MIRITRANFLRLAPQIVDLCADAFCQRKPSLGIPRSVFELLSAELRLRDPEFVLSADNIAALVSSKTLLAGVTHALSNLGLCAKSSAELASIHILAQKDPYQASRKVLSLADQWCSNQPTDSAGSPDLQSEREAFNALPPAERQALVDALYEEMRTRPLTVPSWHRWQATAMIYGLPVIHVDQLFELGRTSLEVTPFVKDLSARPRGERGVGRPIPGDGTLSIEMFASHLHVHRRAIQVLINQGVLKTIAHPSYRQPRLSKDDLEKARIELGVPAPAPVISKPAKAPAATTITAEQLMMPAPARPIRCVALHPDGTLPEAAITAFLAAKTASFVSLSTLATCVFHRQVVARGVTPALLTPLERRGSVDAPYICAVLGEFGITRPAVECLVIDGAFPTSQSDYALIHQALVSHPAQTVLFCTTPADHWHASRYVKLFGLQLPEGLDPADGRPASQRVVTNDQGIRLQPEDDVATEVTIAIGPQIFYDQVVAIAQDLQQRSLHLAGVDPGLARLASLVTRPMAVAVPTPITMEILNSMSPAATRPTLIPTPEYLATLGASAVPMAKAIDRLLLSTKPLQKRARIAPTNILLRRLDTIVESDPRGRLTVDQICDLAFSTPADHLEPVRSGLLGRVVRALANGQPLDVDVKALKEQLGIAPVSHTPLLCWLLNMAVRQPAILTPAQRTDLAALVARNMVQQLQPRRAKGIAAASPA